MCIKNCLSFRNLFMLGVKPIKSYIVVNLIIIFIYSFGHYGNRDDLYWKILIKSNKIAFIGGGIHR